MQSFKNRMKDRFGCSDEIIARWIAFAKDCVSAEQYADFIPAAEEESIQKWLKQIYATLCLVQAEGGADVTNEIMQLTKQHCLYPEEIAGTIQLLTLGIKPQNLMQKSLDGELEVGAAFAKEYNLKKIRAFGYDEADEYFKNYERRLDAGGRTEGRKGDAPDTSVNKRKKKACSKGQER